MYEILMKSCKILWVDYCKGGIKAPDIEIIIKTSKAKWLLRLIEPGKWSEVALQPLQGRGGLTKLVNEKFSQKTLGSLKHNATTRIASLVNLTSGMTKTSPIHQQQQQANNRQVGFSQYQEVIRVSNSRDSEINNNNNNETNAVVKGEYENSLSKSESCSSNTLQYGGTPLAPPPFPVLRQQTIDSIFSTVSDSMKLDSSEDGECSITKTFVLQIHLKEGKDLVIRDTSGTSDPYVKFKYKNKTIYKSTIIYKNLNPVWDERFSHILDDLTLPLIVQIFRKLFSLKIIVLFFHVFDYDRFATDDFMGSAQLDLTQFANNKNNNNAVEIKLFLGENGSSDYMGYLVMQISLIALNPEMQIMVQAITPG
uniref:C2 domain-containing protein n=1 Tax=Romanomermis culicivorax TaxID=13658 RepID=A0A915KEL3_ROMCU